jgi:hypothetical protein
MNRAGIADNDGVRWHIMVDKSPRSDQDIIPDSNLTNDRSVHANTNTTTDGRDTPARPPALHPDSHPFMKVAIVTQNSTSVYGDVVSMSQIETLSDSCTSRNLNPVPSGMKPKQDFIKRSGKGIFLGLALPKKEVP